MHHRLSLILLSLLLLLIAVSATAQPVLLISIDGLRPCDVLDTKTRHLKLPNLTAFLHEGSYARGVRGVLPTLTYPSHTTLLTGVSPAQHGIGGNLSFDPFGKNQYGWMWYAADIRSPTLWDAAHAAGLSTANVHWPVSVGAKVDWNLPQIWRAHTDDDRKLLAALATPGLLPTLEHELGPYAAGGAEDTEADVNRVRFAAKLLADKQPEFMTVYLAALDHIEHLEGPGTPVTDAVLERLDALIGELIKTARRVHPDGVIAVVSDHGFASVTQDVNLYAPFIAEGLIEVKDGAVADWRAMPWNDGGSAAIVLRDPADGATRKKVAALLSKLAADPAYGIDRVLDRAQVAALGGTELAEWFVLLKPGYELATRLDAPMLAPSRYKGMHGYDPALAQMYSAFLIKGPGIPVGRDLGVVDMRDIAPTLAARLGFALPQAQGHDILAPAP